MVKQYFVYILECLNGSYYTGYTVNLEERYQKHIAGTASKYTRAFPPKSIAASWVLESSSASEAMKIEACIKRLTAKQKKTLVSNAGEMLQDFIVTKAKQYVCVMYGT